VEPKVAHSFRVSPGLVPADSFITLSYDTLNPGSELPSQSPFGESANALLYHLMLVYLGSAELSLEPHKPMSSFSGFSLQNQHASCAISELEFPYYVCEAIENDLHKAVFLQISSHLWMVSAPTGILESPVGWP
jgi:hypothetical protein